MIDSSIQWTDHTWNIARGCTKVDEDCKFCYMYRGSLNGTRYEPKKVIRTKTVFNLPLKIKEPSKIFTSSLTDFFHEDIDEYRKEAWDIIRKCPQHTFQILTKRPERINRHTLPFDKTESGGIMYSNLPNVWLGTSIGSQNGLSRLYALVNSVWRGVKFLSLEPLHGPIDFRIHSCDKCNNPVFDHGIDWVIVGGESGNENGQYRYRECKIEWIESIIDQCREFGVPVFVKQLGTHLSNQLKLSDRHGGNINEWPEHLRIREFPSLKEGCRPTTPLV
jgi:protein gp37